MKQYDTAVISVGAGPVGLTPACELRLAGINVTVLGRPKNSLYIAISQREIYQPSRT